MSARSIFDDARVGEAPHRCLIGCRDQTSRRNVRFRERTGGRTDGGEAHGFDNLNMDNPTSHEDVPQTAPWCALWTHAHCEQLVRDQLAAKRFEVFLPMMTVWSRRGGRRHLIAVPMFSGYLFLRHAIDKASCVEILKTRGLTRILGERWDRPAVVADEEIEAMQRALASKLPLLSHPYLQEGQRVRIIAGPLSDVEGIFVQGKPNKGLLVLSVNLLQRSVAVEVDCTIVVPTNPVLWNGRTACALAH